MNMGSSIVVRIAVLAIVGLGLSGCSYIRESAGMNKMAPDEFAVLTKAPLVIPPDFGLMPPKPGAAPTNQTDPAGNAQASLYGADAATVAANMPGNASMAEKLLIANAGAADADHNVRQQLTADANSMLATDDGFTDQLMFWEAKKKPDEGKPVDADAEAKRLSDPQAGKASAPAEKEDKGWFDGWFDWF
jgi:hypothetical protein